ncbi:MAG: ATP-binding cassette domain-containing protein [Lachnospiraceae bacterium]|nr:ATP-binding cassette domain-containing protein [Lachnospiraceae bacterium]
MIEIKNLVKSYGSKKAVDNLSLTIEPGKIYGFLGPNGAGKSTTMNIMTGYLGATSGTVLINGHDIFAEPEEAKKCIGYLPEIPPLYLDMTVEEYLSFVAELKKIPKKDRARNLRESMVMTQTFDVKDRLIRNLSKGYKQRVGFAQAIIGYPDIIILDEPTVGLDPHQIIEIRDLIKSLGEKHTVILSSHILTEISAVCDHVFIISNGKLVASDSTEHLLKSTQKDQAHEIDLVFKGEQEHCIEVLQNVEGVDSAEVVSEENDEFAVRVTATGDVDVREAIFYACADAKMPILEMHSLTKSLEDVFLELTGNETADPSAERKELRDKIQFGFDVEIETNRDEQDDLEGGNQS